MKGDPMKFETKLNKILAMPDSNEKLTKLNRLGLSLGLFTKQQITKETNRLTAAGYKDLALIYLENTNRTGGRITAGEKRTI